jgi:hypothetical protein
VRFRRLRPCSRRKREQHNEAKKVPVHRFLTPFWVGTFSRKVKGALSVEGNLAAGKMMNRFLLLQNEFQKESEFV